MLKDKQFIRVDNEKEYEKLYEMCKLEFGFKGKYTLVDAYPSILGIGDLISNHAYIGASDFNLFFYSNPIDVEYYIDSKYCIPFSSLNNYVLKTELLDKIYDIHQGAHVYDICIFSKDIYLIKAIANYFINKWNYTLGDISNFDKICADGSVGLFLYKGCKNELESLNIRGVLSLCEDFVTNQNSTHCIDADYFINKDVIYDKINKHLYKDGEVTSRKIDVVNFLSEVIMYEEAKIKQ